MGHLFLEGVGGRVRPKNYYSVGIKSSDCDSRRAAITAAKMMRQTSAARPASSAVRLVSCRVGSGGRRNGCPSRPTRPATVTGNGVTNTRRVLLPPKRSHSRLSTVARAAGLGGSHRRSRRGSRPVTADVSAALRLGIRVISSSTVAVSRYLTRILHHAVTASVARSAAP